MDAVYETSISSVTTQPMLSEGLPPDTVETFSNGSQLIEKRRYLQCVALYPAHHNNTSNLYLYDSHVAPNMADISIERLKDQDVPIYMGAPITQALIPAENEIPSGTVVAFTVLTIPAGALTASEILEDTNVWTPESPTADTSDLFTSMSFASGAFTLASAQARARSAHRQAPSPALSDTRTLVNDNYADDADNISDAATVATSVSSEFGGSTDKVDQLRPICPLPKRRTRELRAAEPAFCRHGLHPDCRYWEPMAGAKTKHSRKRKRDSDARLGLAISGAIAVGLGYVLRGIVQNHVV